MLYVFPDLYIGFTFLFPLKCHFKDMGSSGDISLTISNQNFEACQTGVLDTDRGDFNRGYIDSFYGSLINGCEVFELGGDRAQVTISHSGSDRWIGDWIRYIANFKLRFKF